jgi:putative membrane protein
MIDESLVRYAHFVAIIIFSSMLVAEHLLLSKQTSIDTLKKVAVIDLIYGISAVVVLVAGLSLWIGVGKPKEFYTSNFIFHIKLTLFILMAILSIIPTLFYIKSRKSGESVITIPKYIIMVIRFELLLLLIIPLLAVLMARGIGFNP